VKQDSVDLHKAALLAPGAAACSDRALESGKGARERPRTLHTELEIRKSRLRRLTLERELRVAPTFHVLLRLVSREDHIEPTPSNQQIRAVRGRTIAARSATSRGWVCNASSASSSSSHACSGITVTKQWPEPFNDPRLSLIVDSFFSEAQNGPNLHPGTERVDCARCCFVCLQQHLKHSSSWCRQSLAEHLKASQKQETQLIVQSRDPRVREAEVSALVGWGRARHTLQTWNPFRLVICGESCHILFVLSKKGGAGCDMLSVLICLQGWRLLS